MKCLYYLFLLFFPLCLEAQHRAYWIQEARFGVMNHFLTEWISMYYNLEMNPETCNSIMDNFEVDVLTNQLASIQACYCAITIGKNSGYFLYPNPVYEKLTGTGPGKSSRRNLVANLGKALKKRGIRLMVYLPAGASANDDETVGNLEWPNGPYPKKKFLSGIALFCHPD